MTTMAKAMASYGKNSKERFPSESEKAQNWREGTTFFSDFLIAEVCMGDEPNALDQTWGRVWKNWKNSPKYMVELCLCMNHLCWMHSEDSDYLCKWYAEKYHYCKDRIFSDGSEDEPLPEGCVDFSSEDKTMAFDVLD